MNTRFTHVLRGRRRNPSPPCHMLVSEAPAASQHDGSITPPPTPTATPHLVGEHPVLVGYRGRNTGLSLFAVGLKCFLTVGMRRDRKPLFRPCLAISANRSWTHFLESRIRTRSPRQPHLHCPWQPDLAELLYSSEVWGTNSRVSQPAPTQPVRNTGSIPCLPLHRLDRRLAPPARHNDANNAANRPNTNEAALPNRLFPVERHTGSQGAHSPTPPITTSIQHRN